MAMMQFPRHQNLEIDDHDRVNMKPEIDAGILELPKETMLEGSGNWLWMRELELP